MPSIKSIRKYCITIAAITLLASTLSLAADPPAHTYPDYAAFVDAISKADTPPELSDQLGLDGIEKHIRALAKSSDPRIIRFASNLADVLKKHHLRDLKVAGPNSTIKPGTPIADDELIRLLRIGDSLVGAIEQSIGADEARQHLETAVACDLLKSIADNSPSSALKIYSQYIFIAKLKDQQAESTDLPTIIIPVDLANASIAHAVDIVRIHPQTDNAYDNASALHWMAFFNVLSEYIAIRAEAMTPPTADAIAALTDELKTALQKQALTGAESLPKLQQQVEAAHRDSKSLASTALLHQRLKQTTLDFLATVNNEDKKGIAKFLTPKSAQLLSNVPGSLRDSITRSKDVKEIQLQYVQVIEGNQMSMIVSAVHPNGTSTPCRVNLAFRATDKEILFGETDQ